MIIEIFDDIAPEFINEPQALKLRFIDYAKLHYAQQMVGEYYDMIIALYAAHMMTLRARQGKSGMVNSASEGSLSLSFSSSKTDGIFSTSYGQQIDELLKKKILAVRTSSNVKIFS